MKKIMMLMIAFLLMGSVLATDRTDDIIVWNVVTNSPSRTNDIIVFNPSGADSCTYGGSGDWDIDCSENCDVDVATDVGGNNISVTNSGAINITVNITNYDEFHIRGTNATSRCEVHYR